MQLNLLQKSRGTIFSKKANADEKGKVLTVNVIQSEKNSGDNNSGYSRITTLSFDEYGFRLLITDHRGSVFLFNFKENKYHFIVNCSQACTACSFGLKPQSRSEIYVALVDNSIRAYDLGEQQWVGIMRGHTSCIRNISVHQDGELGLTYSVNKAIIWNLLSFTKIRQLCVGIDTGITQVFFLANTILSCFKDDSIHIWDYQTLDCKFRLSSNNMQPLKGESVYRSIAASCDGRLLAAAGKSRYVDIWNLESASLRQTIELPRPILGVRRILFLEPNKIDSEGQETLLAILGEDRRLRLIQLSTCRLLVELSSFGGGGSVPGGAVSSHIDPLVLTMVTGMRRADKLAVVASTPGNLHLYDLAAVWREANKPELPIRRVWTKSGKKTIPKSAEVCNINSNSQSGTNEIGATSETNENTDMKNFENLKVDSSSILDRRKLRGILKEYGKFPCKYRPFIWRGLMQLPGNVSVLTSLLEKGVHTSWDLLPHKYPIKSQKLTRCLQRVLSALAYWSPLFAECDFLPLLAFPFVKVFQNNLLLAFEMVASVLMNWCHDWFEYFPNPPINILCLVENVLAHYDNELYQHFVDLGVTTEIYAWPLMETLFSEVLTKEEWLGLWDNLVCRHPGFLLICVVSYTLCAKGPLMRVQDHEEIESFYRHQNCITSSTIIQRALALDTITPGNIHPSQRLEKYVPLTKGQYPLFHKFPKFIVDHQILERERIRQEEKEYLQQRAEAEEMQRRTEMHVAEEQSWYRQQEMLARAEDRRNQIVQEEEMRLREQKQRLHLLMDRLKKKEQQIMDDSETKSRKFQLYSSGIKHSNPNHTDSANPSSSVFEETEMAIQEAEHKIRNLEIELEKKHRKDGQNIVKTQFLSDLLSNDNYNNNNNNNQF